MIVTTPDDRFVDLPDFPFSPNYFDWEGMRLHYVDEGAGPPVVLFHGEPTWSFVYRKVIAALVEAGFRAVAPDYPGFGRSDKPTEPDFYTYDRLVAAMKSLIGGLGIEEATAVVHDWGGPVGLRVAVETSSFYRLSILNTGLSTGSGHVGEAFLAWRRFVEANPDLPVSLILGNAATRAWDPAVIDAYEAPFPSADHKVGLWRLPLIVPLEPSDAGAAEMTFVRNKLGDWAGPAQVLFSDSDPIFSLGTGKRLVDLIPGATELEVIEGAGHFLQEEEGELVAQALIGFLRSS